MFVTNLYRYAPLVLAYATVGCSAAPAALSPRVLAPDLPSANVHMSGKNLDMTQQGSIIKSGCGMENIANSVELSILSQKIVITAAEASSARAEAFQLLKESRNRFEKILANLKSDDQQKGGLHSLETGAAQLEAVVARWVKFSDGADQILKAEATILQVSEDIEHIKGSLPNLLKWSDSVVQRMIDINAKAVQIYIASRQLLLLERISSNADKILGLPTLLSAQDRQLMRTSVSADLGMHYDRGRAMATDRLGRDASLFGKVLEAMLKGRKDLGIAKLSDPDTVADLQKVSEVYAEFRVLDRILKKAPELFKATEAAAMMLNESEILLKETRSNC